MSARHLPAFLLALGLVAGLCGGGCIYMTGRFACEDDSHCPSWMVCGDGVCLDSTGEGDGVALDCEAPEVHTGTVSLRTASDVLGLVPAGAACLRLEGSLLVEASELVDLAGLERLGEITGSLAIRDNGRLERLTGLSGLASIGGELEIRGNGALTDVSGLSALQEVGSDVEIRDNPSLADEDARALLGQITHIGGETRIRDNGS